MPASFMARLTAAAVSSICAVLPISSGLKARVRPTPIETRRGRRHPPLLAAEHQQMRRQPALGPAGHHDGDPLLDLGERAPGAVGQQQLQRQGGIAAGEVVDAAVALGLADDGDDGRGIDLAPIDRHGERRGVLWAGGGKPQNAGAACHVRPPCRHRCRAARGGGAG
jgi:hypothetical protein